MRVIKYYIYAGPGRAFEIFPGYKPALWRERRMRTDDIAYDKADFDETNEDRRDANEIDELKFESDS